MPRMTDPSAYEQATQKWVLPPCLHVPIVAVEQSAMEDHIGEVLDVVSSGKTLLVRADPPAAPDERLPIFAHENVANLFHAEQLWVSPEYTRYRQAWRRVFGGEGIEDKVLHHVYNRRIARLRGSSFIRLAPVSQGANSNSAFTERLGFDLFTPEYVARLAKQGLRTQ